MFDKLINSLKFTISNDDQDTRRSHQRHDGMRCVAIIDGVTYPIKNWSKGGIMIMGDDRTFGVYDAKDFTLRFKMNNDVIDIEHKGHILRKGRENFILQFAPITQNLDRQFNSILNDFAAQEFMQSQVNT